MSFYWPPTTTAVRQVDGWTVAGTEPASPSNGDVWVDLGAGQMKVWLLGAWRPVGVPDTGDRYGTAGTSLPGLTQQAEGTTPYVAVIVGTVPAVGQAAAGTVAVSIIDGGTPDSTGPGTLDGGTPDSTPTGTVDGGSA